MATERKRKPKPDHVHPAQVGDAIGHVNAWFISPGMSEDEAQRCKHFIAFQFARLMVKLGLKGSWDVTVTAKRRKA